MALQITNGFVYLAYAWSAWNLNRPIRIQQGGKILVSWCKVDKSGKALKSGTFLTGDGVRCPRKGIFNFQNHTSWQKLKSMNHFVFLNFYFGAKNDRHGNSLVVRRVSQGRIIIVLFWTKCAVPRQFKPGILKLTSSRGKRILLTVFIFVSFEEKGCYRIVSLGHQNFDCQSYCELSRRMQGRQLLSFNGLARRLPTICKKSSQRTSNSESRQKKDVLKNIRFSNYFMLAVFISLIKFYKIVFAVWNFARSLKFYYK